MNLYYERSNAVDTVFANNKEAMEFLQAEGVHGELKEDRI